MVGLESVVNIINNYTLDTLPHSILLNGKEGSGKHVLSDYISDKFNLNLLDITDDLSEDLINNIYRNSSPRLYQIDLRKISEKDQNILLKLLEEPSSNTFIILLTNSLFSVLQTIQNRCFIINIENYTKEQLKCFSEDRNIQIDDKYFGNVIQTPGDIIKVDSLNIQLDVIEELVNKLINKLNIASYANTLTIVDKLNFKDEYDKIDVDFFLRLLYINSVIGYCTGDTKLYPFISIVRSTIDKLSDSRMNRRLLISHMLSQLWLEVNRWYYQSLKIRLLINLILIYR